MKFEYEAKRTVLKILDPGNAQMALEFLEKNRDFFGPHEPKKPENYYTKSYIETTMEYEYKLALKLALMRYWVFLKEDPSTIIGTLAVTDVRRGAASCCQIGYRFDKDHLHMGYATESIMTLVPELFTSLGVHRIEANVMPKNIDSVKLLERLGFESEGIARASVRIQGRWEDHIRYALINDSDM